jgi:hypothetical protein
MISSKTGLNQKISSKFFFVKIFLLIFLVQNDFLENRFEPKNFIKDFLSKFF